MTEGMPAGLCAIAAAVGSVWIVGWLVCGLFPATVSNSRWTALAWGAAVFMVGFGLAEQCGLSLKPWLMISVWAMTCLMLGYALRCRRKTTVAPTVTEEDRIPWWLWVQGILVMGVHGVVTTASSLAGPPGIGIYGYRAKVLWLLGRAPDGFHSSPGYDFSNADYPPGWPLLTLWNAVWRGSWEEHWVKLWIPVCLFLSWRITVGWMRKNALPWWCLLAPGLFLLCTPALTWSRWHYSEPLLLLLVVTGLLHLLEGFKNGVTDGQGNAAAGLVLLACCGWVKNEGVGYWMIGAALLLWRWPQGWWKVALTLPLAAGWRILMALHGARTLDYDWGGAFHRPGAASWERICEMVSLVREVCFVSWQTHFGIWWLLPVIAVVAVIRGCGECRALLFAGVCSAVLLWMAFFFSAVPMDQHGLAFDRILTIPAWLILMALCAACGKHEAIATVGVRGIGNQAGE